MNNVSEVNFDLTCCSFLDSTFSVARELFPLNHPGPSSLIQIPFGNGSWISSTEISTGSKNICSHISSLSEFCKQLHIFTNKKINKKVMECEISQFQTAWGTWPMKLWHFACTHGLSLRLAWVHKDMLPLIMLFWFVLVFPCGFLVFYIFFLPFPLAHDW